MPAAALVPRRRRTDETDRCGQDCHNFRATHWQLFGYLAAAILTA
jgi:hypothetical protein